MSAIGIPEKIVKFTGNDRGNKCGRSCQKFRQGVPEYDVSLKFCNVKTGRPSRGEPPEQGISTLAAAGDIGKIGLHKETWH
jgi:hypothetical protein